MKRFAQAELQSVAEIIQGGRHKLSGNHFIPEGGFPAYGAGGLNGYLPTAEFDRAAVILSSIGARCGKCFYAEGKWSSLANTQVILPDESKVDPLFLWYQLNDEKRWPRAGAAQPFIKPSDVKRHKIVLPSLNEQKRIAAILDQADELRRKRQRAIDRINQLGQAIFHEMFGDPKGNPRGLAVVHLGDVADFYSGNSLPEGEPFSGQKDGHLLLKVSDLNHPQNQHDVICAAGWSPVRGSRAGTCPANALVFPKRGGAIGTNKKRWLRRSAILDPNLMGVHPHEDRLTMSFLNGWFQTFDLSDIASGSSVPQLNKQDLAPLEMALPKIEEQDEYARRMEELSRLHAKLRHALEYDNQLFTSLQHRAFQGEL